MTPTQHALLDQVAPEEIPEVIAALSARMAAAWAKRNGNAPTGPTQKEPDILLSIEEALLLLPGVTRRLLLRRTKGLRFRREFSRKKILFEEAGLRKWIVALGMDRKTS
jgi:hypothetical protein